MKTFMNDPIPTRHRLFPALLCCVLTLFLAAGCLPGLSSDPLKPDAAGLHGKWLLQREAGVDVSQQKIKPWVFADDTVKTFSETGTETLMTSHLYQVDNDLFLDVSPYGLDDTNIGRILAIHVAPIHAFFKVRQRDKSISLIPINLALLESGLQQKKINLPHLRAENEDHLLINASIADWLVLIDQHKDDPGFFVEEQEYLLVRSN